MFRSFNFAFDNIRRRISGIGPCGGESTPIRTFRYPPGRPSRRTSWQIWETWHNECQKWQDIIEFEKTRLIYIYILYIYLIYQHMYPTSNSPLNWVTSSDNAPTSNSAAPTKLSILELSSSYISNLKQNCWIEQLKTRNCRITVPDGSWIRVCLHDKHETCMPIWSSPSIPQSLCATLLCPEGTFTVRLLGITLNVN